MTEIQYGAAIMNFQSHYYSLLGKGICKTQVFSQIVPPIESITSAELQALNRRWNGSSYDQQETLKKHSLVFKTHKI